MSSPAGFGHLSAWRDTEGLPDAKARELAARLEHRARAEDESSAREEYLGLFGLVPGERVLDVGCGSGVVTRVIAQRVAPDGKVIGVDASRALLAVAEEYAEASGLGSRIEWRVADCRKLPFADASFDAVIAATMLAHVPGAVDALAEMVRVTKAGGRVGVFDFDGDGLLVTHPDRHLTRRIVAAQCDYGAVNGYLIREIPGLLARYGVLNVKAKAFMPLDRDPAGFYADFAKRAARNAAQAGAITHSELAGWLEQLDEVLQAGRFVGGRLQIFVWGTRGEALRSPGNPPP